LAQEKKFAPHELKSGWAEPLICHCILDYYGIKSSLFKINNFPISMNAPEKCF
jgi:hypothetical protein